MNIKDGKLDFKTAVMKELTYLDEKIFAGTDSLVHFARIMACAHLLAIFLKDIKPISCEELNKKIDELLENMPIVFGSLVDNLADNVEKGLFNPAKIYH